jgi:hypothetical protein
MGMDVAWFRRRTSSYLLQFLGNHIHVEFGPVEPRVLGRTLMIISPIAISTIRLMAFGTIRTLLRPESVVGIRLLFDDLRRVRAGVSYQC